MAESQKRGTRKIRMAAVSMVRAPTAALPLGDPPFTGLREMKEVSLNWSLQPKPTKEPNSVEKNPLLGQGNHIAREKGTGKMKCPKQGKGISESVNPRVMLGKQTVLMMNDNL